MDRCYLSSPDSSSHHAARNHMPAGQWDTACGLFQCPVSYAHRGPRISAAVTREAPSPLAGILDATRRDAGMTEQHWPSWWVVTRVQPGDYPGKQSAQLN